MTKAHNLARQQGATLNDLFLAAMSKSIAELYKTSKVNIPCTVDLRKYANDKTGIANMTGSYNFNIKIKENYDFKMVLEKTSKIMKKLKRSKNDIAGPYLLVKKYNSTSLDKFLKLYGGMNTSAFTDYTNLGVIDSKKLTFNGVSLKNAIGFSGLSKAPNFQVAISTFDGETSIVSLFRCGKNEKDKVEMLLDKMLNVINDFANKIA